MISQIRVREPAGEREFGERLTIGGEGADIVVPGAMGVAFTIERRQGEWFAGSRELKKHDVLSVGEAQLRVDDLARTLLKLDVHHLVGNATIAPVTEVARLDLESGDEDLEIRAAKVPIANVRGVTPPAATPPPPRVPRISSRAWAWILGIPLAALLLVGAGIWLKERIQQAQLELASQPGKLNIDTGGVAASVSIDGVEAGRAPGEVAVPAGTRTITLRAPRHLDYVTTLDIKGAAQTQTLKVALQPSWGKLNVLLNNTGARLSLDGVDRGKAPGLFDAPAGVHRVQVTAPGLKPWESSIVIKAGETLAIGPITLGQPDAHLSVRSRPSGAEIAIAGTYRGRTPLDLDLPAGTTYEIVASLPGHGSWRQSVAAEPGKRVALEARLAPVMARVTVQGEPAGAALLVDGTERGRTPQSLQLAAVEHRIEVRKEGFQPFTTTVQPAQGLARIVEYRLISANRALALQQTAPTITAQNGYVLKLIPGGRFTMGSDRREQGRRPNEISRQVALERPFYLGVNEVTNGEFRKFRPGHASGHVAKQTLDLDAHPVTSVSWDDAAEYCNWLSEREGLPPAYERRDGKFHLKRPATAGYRLPTEAEWEYAARRAGPNRMLRFSWGDSLPVAPQSGNLAGAEAVRLVEVELPGYRDEYVVVAPVGKFKPNALGLHDMGGNVSEWVNDYYLSFVDSVAATDPLGPASSGRHAIRGASWKSTAVSDLRLAWRDSADGPDQTLGFRIARYAE